MQRRAFLLLTGAIIIGVHVAETPANAFVPAPQDQIILVKKYRLAKKYPEALELLSKMIGPKITAKNYNPSNAKDKGWAFASINIRKEKAFVLEDIARDSPPNDDKKMAKWAAAVQEWRTLSRIFAPKLPELPGVALNAASRAKIVAQRALYFELNVEMTRCSVEAYHDIGVAATTGRQDEYLAKFSKVCSRSRRPRKGKQRLVPCT